MKESASVRFLYGTLPGRLLLKLFTRPFISDLSAVFLSSRASRFIIPSFIRNNGIDMDRFAEPEGGFRSFNDFFTRPLKPENEPVATADFISPCDGLLTVKQIEEDSIIVAKNSRYSIKTLLEDEKLAKEFTGGTALIFRLTPSHYHRYCFCADGNITAKRRIDGILHCVRPVAVESTEVYTRNSREYIVIENERLGRIVQMEIGAMLVGRITNRPEAAPPNRAVAGKEKGNFEYGGSTIIVLLDHQVELSREILDRPAVWGEIPVTVGEPVLSL